MKNKYLFRFFPYPGIETVCWENWDFERQQLTLPDGRKVCLDNIQAALNSLRIPWRLNSVQYEDETNLIHYEWTWEVP
jgi:hypothetical protein